LNIWENQNKLSQRARIDYPGASSGKYLGSVEVLFVGVEEEVMDEAGERVLIPAGALIGSARRRWRGWWTGMTMENIDVANSAACVSLWEGRGSVDVQMRHEKDKNREREITR
jgi:hypothetical protein